MNPFVLSLKTYNLDVEIHKHSAFQLVFSTESSFRSIINEVDNQNIHGFVIKPHVSHLCTANNDTINIINIEPYSPAGFYIQTLFETDNDCIIFKTVPEIIGCFKLSIESEKDLTKSLSKLLLENSIIHEVDERVNQILNHIKTHFDQHLTPEIFSRLVFLSPSRLASLFKQQTGSSLSKYLLWVRLREAISLILSKREESLTSIALDTGFYDLPQLNKYMYEMFGVSPRGLRHNSDLIQVLT